MSGAGQGDDVRLDDTDEPLALTVTQATRVLSVTAQTIRKWIRAGQVKAAKIGPRWYLSVPALLRQLEGRRRALPGDDRDRLTRLGHRGHRVRHSAARRVGVGFGAPGRRSWGWVGLVRGGMVPVERTRGGG